ncbi:MAG: alpha/beta hydrolase [Actinomycetia bacterium]|nr:alpha/beta hydrolase [Actinomycetes bacterium]
MTPSTTTTHETVDGKAQLRRRWMVEQPWARVLVLHGINEHSGRYEHVGGRMADAGLDVHAHDHRGHGGTAGRRIYIDSFRELLDDTQAHLADLRTMGQEPVVLIGHSMGGLVALAYCVDDRPHPDVLVTSGAALGADVPEWQKKAAPVLGNLLPRLKIPSSIELDMLSTDPEVGRAYAADPLVTRGVTAKMGQQLMRGMEVTLERLGRLAIPTLALHGGDDRLVPADTGDPLDALATVDREVLPGLRHEILNEPGHDQLIDRIVEWVRAQVVELGPNP